MARPTEVELTGKFWKLQQLFGGVAFIMGGIVFLGGLFGDVTLATWGGGALLLVGFVYSIAANLGAWWNHG